MGIAAVLTLPVLSVGMLNTSLIVMFVMSLAFFAHGIWITNYITSIGDIFGATKSSTVVGLSGTAGAVSSMVINPLMGGCNNQLYLCASVDLFGYHVPYRFSYLPFLFTRRYPYGKINKRIQTHIVTLHTNQHSALTIKQTNVNMDRMKEKKESYCQVFSVGYDVYWAQFPGLLEELLAKRRKMFIRKFPQNEVDIIRFPG